MEKGLRKIFSRKNAAALKKLFTWKRVAIAAAIIAVVAIIAVPRHIANSRTEAVILALEQIALAQMAMQSECMGPPGEYVFTDGLDETAEQAVEKMSKFGFRPNPSVAFHIMRAPDFHGVKVTGFVAFAAHNSVGSTVYVYDNISGRGVVELCEIDEVYGDFKAAGFVLDLHSYTFDSSNKTNLVKKTSIPIQVAPNPKDEILSRMVVTSTAKD